MGSLTSFLAFADTDGDVQQLNAGTSDNGSPIFFELETQALEFGDRARWKQLSDQVGVMGQFLDDTQLAAREEDAEFAKPIPVKLDRRASIGQALDIKGRWITFVWSGQTTTTQPILQALYLDDITDIGLVKEI